MNKSIAISPCLLISQSISKRLTETILIRLSAPPIVQHMRNLVPSDQLQTLSIRLMYFPQLFSNNVMVAQIIDAIPVFVCLHASLSVLRCSAENENEILTCHCFALSC